MRKITCLLWVCIGVIVSTAHAAAILNPGFEQKLEGVSPWYNPPAYWQYENYANVVEQFSSSSPDASWSIDAPYKGDSFLVLATGEAMGEVKDADYAYSKLWQEVTFKAGNTLSFAWFFGTNDWLPYRDYAVANLVPVDAADGLTVIELVNIDVSDVGSFGATKGWQTVGFTFDATNAGRYNLTFEVHDDIDAIISSYFAIDGIVPEPTTILLLAIGGLIARRHR
jgi:hypothetical protein